MPDYSKIQNERLRNLVMLSESIHSLPESEIQAMIDRVTELPPEGQEAMTSALEDEQKQIQEAKQAKGITPEMETQEIEENSLKLSKIKHDFDTAVLEVKKEKEEKDSEAAAASIIKNL